MYIQINALGLILTDPIIEINYFFLLATFRKVTSMNENITVGNGKFNYGVKECVSDIATIRTLLDGISGAGGFIVTFITRCDLEISFQAAVGSFVSGCTSIFIILYYFYFLATRSGFIFCTLKLEY